MADKQLVKQIGDSLDDNNVAEFERRPQRHRIIAFRLRVEDAEALRRRAEAHGVGISTFTRILVENMLGETAASSVSPRTRGE